MLVNNGKPKLQEKPKIKKEMLGEENNPNSEFNIIFKFCNYILNLIS